MDIVISEECIKKADSLRHLIKERMYWCPIAQYFWLTMDPVFVKVTYGFITVILHNRTRLHFITTDITKQKGGSKSRISVT